MREGKEVIRYFCDHSSCVHEWRSAPTGCASMKLLIHPCLQCSNYTEVFGQEDITELIAAAPLGERSQAPMSVSNSFNPDEDANNMDVGLDASMALSQALVDLVHKRKRLPEDEGEQLKKILRPSQDSEATVVDEQVCN